MSVDFAECYERDLMGKIYAEWGKRHMSTPPKKKKKYTGSRKFLREMKKARLAK